MFIKYPRTIALQSVGLNAQDLLAPQGQSWVIEEKMDGTQTGFYFDHRAQPVIQSRGTIIGNEPEFSRLKSWLWENQQTLYALMGQRYVFFGEWLCYAHHIFYDQLPNYWMEFDIYDLQSACFLSTPARQDLLSTCPFISSVRVLTSTSKLSLNKLWPLIAHSAFISTQAVALLQQEGISYLQQSNMMEGLYIKLEDRQKVLARYKLIRPEFINEIVAQAHWRKQKIFLNKLRV